MPFGLLLRHLAAARWNACRIPEREGRAVGGCRCPGHDPVAAWGRLQLRGARGAPGATSHSDAALTATTRFPCMAEAHTTGEPRVTRSGPGTRAVRGTRVQATSWNDAELGRHDRAELEIVAGTGPQWADDHRHALARADWITRDCQGPTPLLGGPVLGDAHFALERVDDAHHTSDNTRAPRAEPAPQKPAQREGDDNPTNHDGPAAGQLSRHDIDALRVPFDEYPGFTFTTEIE